jgi:hypothetical protein
MVWILNGKLKQLENYVNLYNMSNSNFEIDYSNFNPDKDYTIKNEKVSKSNARIIADAQTAERNKDPKFREKVSNGVKKFYNETLGTIEERFLSNIIKEKNGCWNFKHTWFYDEDGNTLQPKEYSLKYHNIEIPDNTFNIRTNCGNSKCINPNHIIFMTKMESTEFMRNEYKKQIQNSGKRYTNAKLSNDELDAIKKMYIELLNKQNGKHKGISTKIHKLYPHVTLSLICSYVDKLRPKHIQDITPILMYEYDDIIGGKGKFIKKYNTINDALIDDTRKTIILIKKNIVSVLEKTTQRTGHGKTRKGGYVFEYEK